MDWGILQNLFCWDIFTWDSFPKLLNVQSIVSFDGASQRNLENAPEILHLHGIHSTLNFLQSTYNKKTNYNMNWRWHTYNLPFWIIFCSYFSKHAYMYHTELKFPICECQNCHKQAMRTDCHCYKKQGIIFFLYFLGFDILSLRPSALQSLTFKFWPSPQILSVLDKATHRNAVHWLYKAKLWAHECYVQGPTKLTSSMLRQKKKNLGFFCSSTQKKKLTRCWTFREITQLCWT